MQLFSLCLSFSEHLLVKRHVFEVTLLHTGIGYIHLALRFEYWQPALSIFSRTGLKVNYSTSSAYLGAKRLPPVVVFKAAWIAITPFEH